MSQEEGLNFFKKNPICYIIWRALLLFSLANYVLHVPDLFPSGRLCRKHETNPQPLLCKVNFTALQSAIV